MTGIYDADVDLVVVGGGIAGLAATIEAVRGGLRVVTVAKSDAAQTSTNYAQGGIAISYGDDLDAHVADTCAAGAGLCDDEAVRSILGGGPAALETLAGLGAMFDRSADGSYALTREGGHAVPRIVHAGGDATGAEVQRVLSAAGPTVLLGTSALRVLTGSTGVTGVLVRGEHGFGVLRAPAVLLATGGLGHMYACSTNPPAATGDGIFLALSAGAVVADLEFVQFHPTVLFDPAGRGRRPLISEAVRGEGAFLVDLAGRSVTAGVHPMGDLAPRDVVSRAIATRLRERGDDHVLLDARGIEHFAARFPTITASCRKAGLDPSVDRLPVAPAAHYACGGVVTDVHGRTAVAGLYAAGEVARTGLHGANRLASNSLVEGAVVGTRVGIAARERRGLPTARQTTRIEDVLAATSSAPVLDRAAVQRIMTEQVGVVREQSGLGEATAELAAAAQRPILTVTDAEDAALTLVATVVTRAATERTETRGAHTRLDHRGTSQALARSTAYVLGPTGTIESAPTPTRTSAPISSGVAQ